MSNKKPVKKRPPKSWWYYLERYVHISIKAHDILLYNTLTGKHLEYRNRPQIVRFVKGMLHGKKLQVIRITSHYLNSHPGIARFVKVTRENYMADLLDTSYSKGKPVQLLPILNIYRDVNKMKIDPVRSVGEDVLKNLDQINLYIHNRANPLLEKKYPRLFDQAYKQFLFNYNQTRAPAELDVQRIKLLAREIPAGNLTFINILGGNIFKYKCFEELLEILSPLRGIKNFYVPLTDITPNILRIKQIHSHNFPYQLIVLIPFPVDSRDFALHIGAIREIGCPYLIECAVQDEPQMETAYHFSESCGIQGISIRPFFNGKNLMFFKKHVFLNKSDIMASKPDIKDIFMRTAVNPANFGKLTVLTDGSIYANVNAPRLGKLGNQPVYEMVVQEMSKGRSWLRVRSSVQPCKKCLYNSLCPPLMNYECAIGRNNLCNCFK